MQRSVLTAPTSRCSPPRCAASRASRRARCPRRRRCWGCLGSVAEGGACSAEGGGAGAMQRSAQQRKRRSRSNILGRRPLCSAPGAPFGTSMLALRVRIVMPVAGDAIAPVARAPAENRLVCAAGGRKSCRSQTVRFSVHLLSFSGCFQEPTALGWAPGTRGSLDCGPQANGRSSLVSTKTPI